MTSTIVPFLTRSSCALLLAGALSTVSAAAEIRNGGFETFAEVQLDTGSLPVEWPSTDTWCRSYGGLTPYTVSGEDAQEGNAFVVLYQWSPAALPFFGLAHESDSKDVNATGTNMLAVNAGKSYTISFSARRWLDEAKPIDVANMGFLPPAHEVPAAQLRAYAFFSRTQKIGADAQYLGEVTASAEPGKDGNVSITGKWAPAQMTVTAPADGFLWLGFKIKPPTAPVGLPGYNAPAVAGVKFALDDVKISEDAAP